MLQSEVGPFSWYAFWLRWRCLLHVCPHFDVSSLKAKFLWPCSENPSEEPILGNHFFGSTIFVWTPTSHSLCGYCTHRFYNIKTTNIGRTKGQKRKNGMRRACPSTPASHSNRIAHGYAPQFCLYSQRFSLLCHVIHVRDVLAERSFSKLILIKDYAILWPTRIKCFRKL